MAHGKSGLAAEVSGRDLLSHESKGFRDRDIVILQAWEPRLETDRGPSLTLSQTLGEPATGGFDALVGREVLAGLAANDNGDELANRRLEPKFGYGFSAFGDRFTSLPEIEVALSQGHREYSAGWRPGLTQDGPTSLEMRREPVNDNADPEHGIPLRLTAWWYPAGPGADVYPHPGPFRPAGQEFGDRVEMNRSEMVRQVAGLTGLGTTMTGAGMKTALSAVADALKRGETVRLAGLGAFAAKDRPARTVRDPRTRVDRRTSQIVKVTRPCTAIGCIDTTRRASKLRVAFASASFLYPAQTTPSSDRRRLHVRRLGHIAIVV